MAKITLQGNPVDTIGDLPTLGMTAPNFTLTKADLSDITLKDFSGKNLILNIFPSIDTGTCAMSVRQFNEKAASLKNTTVLCVSADLPFALARFCGAEGISNVETASTFRSNFAEDYQAEISTGPLTGLLSRAIIIIDPEGKISYTEQVSEIANEPDYDSALAALS